ncbi:unnamed protein product [Lampetra fluviatilis]
MSTVEMWVGLGVFVLGTDVFVLGSVSGTGYWQILRIRARGSQPRERGGWGRGGDTETPRGDTAGRHRRETPQGDTGRHGETQGHRRETPQGDTGRDRRETPRGDTAGRHGETRGDTGTPQGDTAGRHGKRPQGDTGRHGDITGRHGETQGHRRETPRGDTGTPQGDIAGRHGDTAGRHHGVEQEVTLRSWHHPKLLILLHHHHLHLQGSPTREELAGGRRQPAGTRLRRAEVEQAPGAVRQGGRGG